MSSLAPAQSSKTTVRLFERLRLDRPRSITILMLLLVALAPPAYLAQTGGALATGYTIQRLQTDRNTWKIRNQQLELELAKARSLTWVEAEAVNRLKMQRPTQQTVIRVDVSPPLPRPPVQMEGRGSQAEARQPVEGRPSASTSTAETPRAGRVGALLADLIVGR